jgi:hypothetical protein
MLPENDMLGKWLIADKIHGMPWCVLKCCLYKDHVPKSLLLSNIELYIATTYGSRINESRHFPA